MSQITPKQRKAIQSLATGHSVAQSAVIAGCAERTLYAWKRQNHFKNELQRVTDDTISDSVVFLSSALLTAFKQMVYLCENAEDERTRLAAAKCIADSMLRVVRLRFPRSA